jgi:hypothetical protein
VSHCSKVAKICVGLSHHTANRRLMTPCIVLLHASLSGSLFSKVSTIGFPYNESTTQPPMEMMLIGFKCLQASRSTLQWEHRWPRIQQRLAEMQTDIVCLQEVNHFDDCYGPHMASLGYDGARCSLPTSFSLYLCSYYAVSSTPDSTCDVVPRPLRWCMP